MNTQVENTIEEGSKGQNQRFFKNNCFQWKKKLSKYLFKNKCARHGGEHL